MDPVRPGQSGGSFGSIVPSELKPVRSTSLTELLWAIESLRSEVRAFTHRVETMLAEGTLGGAKPALVSSPNPAAENLAAENLAADLAAACADRDIAFEEVERLMAETASLRAERDQALAERDALKADLLIVKRELSFLISQKDDSDRLTLAEKELRAVVTTTEEATNTILDAAEKIIQRASAIKSVTKSKVILQDIEDLQSLVMTVMEACNFQDLTGQRLNKVVNALTFMEEHIRIMVDVFGEMELASFSAEVAQALPEDDESHLLNGPQDKERSISQAEIDALFG